MKHIQTERRNWIATTTKTCAVYVPKRSVLNSHNEGKFAVHK